MSRYTYENYLPKTRYARCQFLINMDEQIVLTEQYTKKKLRIDKSDKGILVFLNLATVKIESVDYSEAATKVLNRLPLFRIEKDFKVTRIESVKI